MEQQLRALRQHVLVASSSSSSAAAMAAGALEGVARVYEEHAESLARSAARADRVEDELEASVALLDACAAARDVLGAMRARAVAAEAAARRLDGAAADGAARAYARLAKRACADARRQRRRAGSSSIAMPPSAEAELDGGHALQEARRLTVAVLERVVVALSRRVPAVGGGGPRRSASASSWSTCVARAFRKSARVACEDDAGDMLTTSSLSSKDSHDGEAALRAQRDLRPLVDTIRQLEDGLELLFRRLVQCRVCLLNTRSF
ncbi:unnamed protein product [Miscanthus lutarioriparius]|uniref:Uncharacterized protein n=1 Tax=Miscanthus lutarioriparius TaxID=422564 RepID=A0A811R4N6_9POAL|nr:unnamed protein product [Miscanthus lutarioriparius]